MSMITEIIKDKSKANFNKDKWKQEKQDENKRLYGMVDEAAPAIVSNAQNFKQYLNIESHNDQYSVRNLMLVFAQMPEATLIKDKKVWKEEHVYKKSGEKEIIIKEPNGEYIREDGTAVTNYISKYMLDISQTNAKHKMPVKETYDDRTRLKMLIENAPVNFNIKDDLPDNAYAYYDPTDKTIYAQADLSSDVAFTAIAKEIAHAEMDNGNSDYDRDDVSMHAYCCAYMISKKLNVDISNFDFNFVSEAYKGLDVNEIKNDLSDLRNSYANMSERVNLAIYRMKEKQKEVKPQER